MLLVELRLLPLASYQYLAQMLHRIPHIFKPDVQRRKPKAQDVFVDATIARAVVANHATRNQRLHDSKGTGAQGATGSVLAGQARLRAALGVIARGGQAQALALAALFHKLDEQVGQRQ